MRIAEWAAGDDLPFALGLCHDRVFVRADGIETSAPLMATPFPDYSTYVPETVAMTIVVNRDALFGALSRALAMLADQDKKSVRLTPGKGRLHVRIDGEDLLLFDEMIDATVTGSIHDSVPCNVEALVKGVEVLDVREVCLGFDGPYKPLQVFSKEEPGYRFITMPMMDSGSVRESGTSAPGKVRQSWRPRQR
jgi:DNA polymerase III sliding clamp (beta) subunit (PCNA family)